jgi:Carboxypeptidase regulatory-like domain
MGLVSAQPGVLSLSINNSSVAHSFGRLTAIIFMLSTFFSAAAHAQVAGGTLSGTVADPNGGGVPNALVVITNVDTGVDREVKTNSDGYYTVVNLVPGKYQLKVTANGFNPEETTGSS